MASIAKKLFGYPTPEGLTLEGEVTGMKLVTDNFDAIVVTYTAAAMQALQPGMKPTMTVAVHDTFVNVYSGAFKCDLTLTDLESIKKLNDVYIWAPITEVTFRMPCAEFPNGCLITRVVKREHSALLRTQRRLKEKDQRVSKKLKRSRADDSDTDA